MIELVFKSRPRSTSRLERRGVELRADEGAPTMRRRNKGITNETAVARAKISAKLQRTERLAGVVAQALVWHASITRFVCLSVSYPHQINEFLSSMVLPDKLPLLRTLRRCSLQENLQSPLTGASAQGPQPPLVSVTLK